jgi:hypothetical protein
MRSVNTNLRSLSADLGASEPVAFFCECRRPACLAVLWMTNADFDAAIEAGETWMVLTGHQPSEPFPGRVPPTPLGPTPPRGASGSSAPNSRTRALARTPATVS